MLYLIAKHSHMGTDVDGLACSLHYQTVCSHQRGGQSLLTGIALSCHAAEGRAIISGDAKPPGLDILCGVDRLGTCKTEFYMEKPAFTRVGLSDIRHQSYHGYYVCTLGGVAISGGDGIDSCTRVPATRHAWGMWSCSVVRDSKCCRYPRPRCLVKIYLILEAPGWSD
jgi:hypothetical protein